MQGGYDHYMQKEIHEQPESILQSMRGRVRFEKANVNVRAQGLCTLSTLGRFSGC
jgi:glucosamine 6-phosphate synthetase-like amidotransferase/phosphosugar isomerase protein